MKIKLSKVFSRNSAAADFDVKQMKKALNRLGYYQPYEKVGITGLADAGVFDALKAFQKDHGLSATGTAKPDDETIDALNREASKTPEGQYIWRTVEDDRVRGAHAGFNRTVRDWGDDPDPGEEFNCRCWAAPVSCDKEFITQNVISEIKDDKYQWTWADYLAYFYVAEGTSITLPDIGWLGPLIESCKEQVFPAVEEQVAELARKIEQGALRYTTRRSYPFEKISYPIGGGTVSSETIGTVTPKGKCLIIDAEVTYTFFDDFTDPANIREGNQALQEDIFPAIFPRTIFRKGTPEWLIFRFEKGDLTDLKGTPYPIHGTWKTKLSGIIKRSAQ